MFTFKNVMAGGLFLFGTTFLWMTAAMAGKTPPPEGTEWNVEQVLAFVAIIGFSAAAWGVFKDLAWWEPVALGSAIVGLVSVIPYTVGISHIGGFSDLGVEINLVMHLVGSAAVLAIVVVPVVHDWVTHRLV
jgi:hypothetical protein